MNDWDALGALEAHLWHRLARAAADPCDAWRLVTLATTGPDGPQARLAGLRRADAASGEVEIHTDSRTPKVAQLRADPRAQLLFWDAATREQLRLSVEMRIEASDPARWARVPGDARLNYGTDPAPGVAIDAPEAHGRSPDIARFAALVGRVRALDAVRLSVWPHRRAIARDGVWKWVAP